MSGKQRFKCTTCGYEKWLPESPTDGKRRVQTGCEWCETIKTFQAVGTVRPPNDRNAF